MVDFYSTKNKSPHQRVQAPALFHSGPKFQIKILCSYAMSKTRSKHCPRIMCRSYYIVKRTNARDAHINVMWCASRLASKFPLLLKYQLFWINVIFFRWNYCAYAYKIHTNLQSHRKKNTKFMLIFCIFGQNGSQTMHTHSAFVKHCISHEFSIKMFV